MKLGEPAGRSRPSGIVIFASIDKSQATDLFACKWLRAPDLDQRNRFAPTPLLPAQDYLSSSPPADTRISNPRRFWKASKIKNPRRPVKGSGTTYPEPGVIQLLATAHLLGSKGQRVTAICDKAGPRFVQDGPR